MLLRHFFPKCVRLPVFKIWYLVILKETLNIVNFYLLHLFRLGDDLGSYVLRESTMRQEQITSPSLSFLLPSKLFWKPNEVLVETDRKNYTIDDLQEFFM